MKNLKIIIFATFIAFLVSFTIIYKVFFDEKYKIETFTACSKIKGIDLIHKKFSENDLEFSFLFQKFGLKKVDEKVFSSFEKMKKDFEENKSLKKSYKFISKVLLKEKDFLMISENTNIIFENIKKENIEIKFIDLKKDFILNQKDLFKDFEKVLFFISKNMDKDLKEKFFKEKENYKNILVKENGDIYLKIKTKGEIKVPFENIKNLFIPKVKNIFEKIKKEKKFKKIGKIQYRKLAETRVKCFNEKCVALTFDDGPYKYTSKLLEILKEKKVSASFFVLGHLMEKYPNVIKRIIGEGHNIFSHSWNHPDLRQLSDEEILWQIKETDKSFVFFTGTPSKYYRPPYGSYDKRVDRIVGKKKIMWSLDSNDWKLQNSNKIHNLIVDSVKSGDVILLHDIHLATINSVGKMIDNLKSRGFRFVLLDNLID